ncbi:TonB-dependent receptor plug domain-containing protein [Solilutibacter silvestris]|uniref:TonB-dependent Receptor Plug Domain n=1 Tax=Solilutibacter silvestris TaxID=1645665 RepID=A0A2K1Q100_9GAMM|nr:TonB-dependent receptor [Lysobacter silvestris]PNS08725.1 TonB-dependent Receptor Plug Domain [Lysobacter silvestris]
MPKYSKLTYALLAALALSSTAVQAQEQASPTGESKKDDATLGSVTITGSRIPRSQAEGAAPVTVISGEEIKKQGFTSVYELANSLTQTGVAESPPTWGSTSVNARQLNLRNMGSGRSLLLVNGHRVDDYPQPAAGKTNFQNLNNIPTGMIDRIEVLASGASSIYGSDAVAGVLNIILKDHFEGDDFKIRAGSSTRGGRQLSDLNYTGGRARDNWSVVYNVQLSHRSGLFGRDRPYTQSDSDAGYGAWDYNARAFGYPSYPGLQLQDNNGVNITPPAGSCGAFGSHFYPYDARTMALNGHTPDPSQVTNNGTYCAQRAVFENWVLSPSRTDKNFYVSANYDINKKLTAYATVGYWSTVGISNTELPFLYPMGGLPNGFLDQTTGKVINNYFRQLTPAELGNYGNTYDREKNWDIHFGLKGSVFNDRFNWDLNLGHSKYIVKEHYTGLNEQGMFDFFFGPQLGTDQATGNAIYALNSNRFWNPITPFQYASFGVQGVNASYSWMNQAEFNINGDLFHTWAGPVGFAGVLEANRQGYKLIPDARGNTTTFGDPFQDYNTGGGTRTRYSAGAEFRIPLLRTLNWGLSGRIDHYDDASATKFARTWGTSFEWRPYDGLLLRGTYGTNFHAPDMQYIYKNGNSYTVGIYSDPYQCIVNNDPVCAATQHSTYYTLHAAGGPHLLPETGKSWTYGVVWDLPWAKGLSVSADYWYMGIDNSIDNVGSDTLLTDEAGCRTGKVVGGGTYTAHAPGSAYCQQAIADVARGANGAVSDVYTGPINQSKLYVSGVDASVKYNHRSTRWGTFTFAFDWTDNLTYKSQTLATDPYVNTRTDHPFSKTTASLEWAKGHWDTLLYVNRVGGVRANNWGGCERLANGVQPSLGDADCVVYRKHIPAWITASGSVGYRFNDSNKLTLFVSNIFDKVGGIPYYAGGFEFIPAIQGATYVGREVSLEYNFKFK